jgi:hypothetical protein
MATIASINPFPNDVRTAFEAYISNPTYYNRGQLNSQARKDLSIGVQQEDPTMAPIFESELESEPSSEPARARAIARAQF